MLHLKLEKQLTSITQVAIIVHNDFYYLSQEVLGLAFQVHFFYSTVSSSLFWPTDICYIKLFLLSYKDLSNELSDKLDLEHNLSEKW
jgi:hypothetical protein